MRNNRYLLFVTVLTCFFITGIVATGLAAREVDNTIYAWLLEKHVRDGFVDYDGFKDEEDKLDLRRISIRILQAFF